MPSLLSPSRWNLIAVRMRDSVQPSFSITSIASLTFITPVLPSYLTGFSSGGHLATLLGTSGGDRYLEGEGDYPGYFSRVQAVVDHFGPTENSRSSTNSSLTCREKARTATARATS
jgi:hypothetical protein